MESERALMYLGMAGDIALALSLGPFRTIMAIDAFDPAYAPGGSFLAQKREILDAMRHGTNRVSGRALALAGECREWGDYEFMDFEPCRILSEKDDGKLWRVEFEQGAQRRSLLYFHHADYLRGAWPKEAAGIDELTAHGAPLALESEPFRAKLRQRCAPGCVLHFPLWGGPLPDVPGVEFSERKVQGRQMGSALLLANLEKLALADAFRSRGSYAYADIEFGDPGLGGRASRAVSEQGTVKVCGTDLSGRDPWKRWMASADPADRKAMAEGIEGLISGASAEFEMETRVFPRGMRRFSKLVKLHAQSAPAPGAPARILLRLGKTGG